MNAGTGSPFVDINAGDQLGRVEIAVAPNNSNYIYAQAQSIVPNSNGGCGNAQGCQSVHGRRLTAAQAGLSWRVLRGARSETVGAQIVSVIIRELVR